MPSTTSRRARGEGRVKVRHSRFSATKHYSKKDNLSRFLG